MHYCPECQKPYAEDDFDCPRCGYTPSEEKTAVMKSTSQPAGETTLTDPIESTKGSGGSKTALWVAVSLGTILVLVISGVATYFLIGTRNSSAYQQKIKAEWQIAVQRSDELTQDSANVKTETQLKPFSESLSDYRYFLLEEKAKIEAMQPPGENISQHKAVVEALDRMQMYVKSLKSGISSDLSTVTDKDFTAVDDSSGEAKASYKVALAANPFLVKIDEAFFEMHSTIGPTIAVARTKAAAAAKKAKQEALQKAAKEKAKLNALRNKQKQQELEADIARAREVVTDFMSSILNAKYNHAGSLLEGEAAGQYDPSIQGQGDFQMTGYDVSSGEVTDLDNYRFYVTENDKDWNGSYFENRWKFVVNPKTMQIMRRQLMN